MDPSTIQTVLVTGATGFIGAHIVDALLAREVKVIGTARSEAKASAMSVHRAQSTNEGKFNMLLTGDLTKPGAFDEAVKGVDAIIHTASPLGGGLLSNFEQEIVDPAIQGTLSILKSASNHSQIKRIVMTSSFASVIDDSKILNPSSPPGTKKHTFTAADWNPIKYLEAVETQENYIAYRGSKKYAEEAAIKFVENNKTSFDLVTLCPPMVFGPWVHPLDSLSEINFSNESIRDLVLGADPIPTSRVTAWVDVRDLAQAHVGALFNVPPGTKAQDRTWRYIPVAPEKFTYQLAADILRREPEFKEWAPNIVIKGDEGAAIPELFDVDGEPAAKELGVTYRSWRETVVDTARQIRAQALKESK